MPLLYISSQELLLCEKNTNQAQTTETQGSQHIKCVSVRKHDDMWQ
jgi:hypothetical protein